MFNVDNSERLCFRLIKEHDAELLFNLDQDPEVMKFINDGQPNAMTDITELLIPRMLKYRDEQQGWGIWQVSLTENQQYLGWILLRPMYFFSEKRAWDDIEIGWRFFKKDWGNGYATEAAKAFLNKLSGNPEINKVSAIADELNYASIKVMKKLGMQFIKKELHKDPLGNAKVVFYQMQV